MGRDGGWRRRRLRDARLYLCTAVRDDLEAFLDAVLDGGVDIVQLRDKDAPRATLVAAAAVFRAAAERHGALFVCNDDPELAATVEADGVHVGQDDPHPREARMAVGPDRLVGRSTHTVAEVSRALREDCDYFAVGPVHPTPTKQGRPPVGLGPVRLAAAVAGDRPWFVTGGMDVHTVPEVQAAGAGRIVVVRALTAADDPREAARQLDALLR